MPTVSSHKRVFLDTSVLVYTDDPRFPSRQDTALQLAKHHRREGTGVVSIQVLQEYFAAVTTKFKLDALTARRKVETLCRFHVAQPDAADVLASIDLHRLHQVSLWDALILRMARQSGCTLLLTEDMQPGRVIDGVRIRNPFVSE